MTPAAITLILKLIDLALLVLEKGPAMKAEYDKLRTEIAGMVADGRNPTEEEWSTLAARVDAAHARIQNPTPPFGI